MSKVFKRSIVWATEWTLRPDRIDGGEGGVDKQDPGHGDGPVLCLGGASIMRHASCTCALLNAFTGQKVVRRRSSASGDGFRRRDAQGAQQPFGAPVLGDLAAQLPLDAGADDVGAEAQGFGRVYGRSAALGPFDDEPAARFVLLAAPFYAELARIDR